MEFQLLIKQQVPCIYKRETPPLQHVSSYTSDSRHQSAREEWVVWMTCTTLRWRKSAWDNSIQDTRLHMMQADGFTCRLTNERHGCKSLCKTDSDTSLVLKCPFNWYESHDSSAYDAFPFTTGSQGGRVEFRKHCTSHQLQADSTVVYQTS